MGLQRIVLHGTIATVISTVFGNFIGISRQRPLNPFSWSKTPPTIISKDVSNRSEPCFITDYERHNGPLCSPESPIEAKRLGPANLPDHPYALSEFAETVDNRLKTSQKILNELP